MILKEGGNAFADAVPFDHKKIPAITKQINKILDKAKARAYPIGSGATPTPGKQSGDLDMIVDADILANHFQSTDIKDVRKQLRAMFDAAGFQTTQSGVSVHVRAEVGDEAHQVDIMIVKDAARAAGFHTHTIPQGSPYKGVHKQIMIANLAKEQNLLWSPYEGLFTRDDAGKKNKLLTNDIDDIAKTLLGDGAKGSDLGSVESMLAKLPKDRADAVMQRLSQDPAWTKSLKTESLEVRRLKQLSGIIQL
jgi:hypothetical protein